MKGWIKLYRELMTKAIWLDSTPEQKVVLMTLLMMANHEGKEWEYKGERYKAQPGQFVTSLDSIVENCGKGISIQNVRTALTKFEKYGFLTNESTNKNRLITIVNWDLYQGSDDETNKQGNKQLTSNQQATNKQLTTNKNDKNVKNDKKLNKESIGTPTKPKKEKPKKVKYAEYVSLTEEEHQKLFQAYGSEKLTAMIDRLNNYKASTGKKYTSDYHTLLENGWVHDWYEKEKSKVVPLNKNQSTLKNFEEEKIDYDEVMAVHRKLKVEDLFKKD